MEDLTLEQGIRALLAGMIAELEGQIVNKDASGFHQVSVRLRTSHPGEEDTFTVTVDGRPHTMTCDELLLFADHPEVLYQGKLPPTTVVHCQHDTYDVYIGRANARYGLPESIWHNPFRIGADGSREQVIARYRDYLLNNPDLLAQLPELRGKRLGCFCKPLPCHGDVLVELLNELYPEET